VRSFSNSAALDALDYRGIEAAHEAFSMIVPGTRGRDLLTRPCTRGAGRCEDAARRLGKIADVLARVTNRREIVSPGDRCDSDRGRTASNSSPLPESGTVNVRGF
jgi:hypothetical protein